jgi:AcrR family transcriptional regulator
LSAALEELARVGYAPLRLEDVADRAKVAKTTVYRRFPTKAELVHAAIRAAGDYDAPLPDTGDVRRDILELLDRSIRLFDTPQGRAIARMLTTEGPAAEAKEIEALLRRIKSETRARRAEVIRRAQARGELPDDADATLIMDAVFTSVMSPLVRFGERTSRSTCKRLIDLVVTGAKHGGGRIDANPRKANGRAARRVKPSTR